MRTSQIHKRLGLPYEERVPEPFRHENRRRLTCAEVLRSARARRRTEGSRG